jgi:CRP-like cAMP-binding protein
MTLARPERQLRLSLRSDDLLPSDLSWRIESGYIRANTWNEEGDSITLGLWGPGELITPTGCGLSPYELVSLSPVVVQEVTPSEGEYRAFLKEQITQTTTLLQINRLRPAELRLLHLLRWITERFGLMTSDGATLPIEAMNLTHRHLAEISGMTRVTVTKAISYYRRCGVLVRVDQQDLLVEPSPVRGLKP